MRKAFLSLLISVPAFAVDVIVEPSRLKLVEEDVSWSPNNRLHLTVDGRSILASRCGEMSHVYWVMNEYNKILVSIPDGKRVRIEGGDLCPINSYASDTVTFQIVD